VGREKRTNARAAKEGSLFHHEAQEIVIGATIVGKGGQGFPKRVRSQGGPNESR